jgi:hypothetical protein
MSSFTYRGSFLLTVIVVLGSAAASCRKSDHYCPGAPLDNCNYRDAIGMCTRNDDCSAPAAICDVEGSRTCVQCLAPDQTSACGGTIPVCGDDHACRGCSAHGECPVSDVCLPDGRCAEPAEVAYVQAGGAGTQPCARGAPCGKLQEGVTAVSASRPYIKISGTGTLADSATTTIDGKAVTILADPGAKLDRTGDGVILEVRNTGADVRIYDLEITGASGGAGDVGVSMVAGGMPKLTLTRAKVTNNTGGGISASGGTLTVSQSTISNNTGGGISVMNGTFVIVSNVFFNNGNDTTLVGGVAIGTPQNAANRLEFNSFTRNKTQDTLGTAIHCIAGTFTARNNIMSDNGTLTNMNQVGGSCMHVYSIARPGTVPPGTGNSNMDPLFVNTTTGDLHVRAGSPVLGAADPSSNLTGLAERDIDGDARAAPADIGADEAP